MPDWVWLAAGGVAAAGGAGLVLVRWLVGPILGPMFRYELVRLTRRGQLPRLRALLVGLLFVGLFITYLQRFRGQERAAFLLGGGETRLSLDETAAFAGNFFIAFLTAQLAAVVLITPAVAGNALTEEKERNTLDYLRSSLLTNREIVLGKLAARAVYVAGVVLAGVPVLALTSLFGGVDWRVVLAGYLVTAATGVGLAAFSMVLGVYKEGLREVLVWVYGVTAGLAVFGLCCGCCVPGVGGVSPVSVMVYMFADMPGRPGANNPSEGLFWVNVAVLVVLYGIAALVCTVLAVVGVRGAAPVRRRPPKMRYVGRRARPVRAEPVRDDDRGYVPVPVARRRFTVPRLGRADPFLWKERYFSGRMAFTEGGLLTGCGIGLLSAVLFGLGLALFVAASVELNEGRWIGSAVNPFLRLFESGASAATGLAVGVRGAAAVARERQKQTLDGLLTLPVGRGTILRAKLVAQLFWARYALIGMAAAAGLALIAGGVHPVGLLLGLVQTTAFVGFAATLGLWLSVRCRTVNRATVYFLVWVLGLTFGPVVFAPVVGVLAGGVEDAGAVALPFSPPVGVWTSFFGWKDVPAGRDDLWWGGQVAGGVAACLYLVGAWVLWLDAVRVFTGEGE